MSTITKDLGIVTAYGYAVSKGYTGTEEEFAELMASYATVAEQAAQSAETAEEAAQAAAQAVLDANAAKTAAQAAQSAAESASTTATNAATSASNSATSAASSASSASTASTAATTATEKATEAAASATAAAGSATAAETAQEAAEEAQGKAEEAAESINPDTLAKINGYYQDMTVGEAEQLLATVGNEDSVPCNFRTSGGGIDIGDREEDMVVGGTICWNQMVTTELQGFSSLAVTKTTSGDEISITSASDSAEVKGLFLENSGLTNGHVYYACCVFKTDSESYAAMGFRKGGLSISDGMNGNMGWDNTETYTRMERICVIQNGSIFGVFLRNDTPSSGSATFKNVQLFDLTQMFGSTVATYIHNLEAARLGDGVAFFKKLFPKDYYEYNAGELMSVKTSAHKMVGFNAWDGILESGGINTNTGAPQASTTSKRSKNFIKCLPNTAYYLESENVASYLWFYDYNKNFISFSTNVRRTVFTTPQNCYYMKLRVGDAMNPPPTTSDGICINLSWDGERDGEYEDYVEHVYPLDSSLELRGIPKLDSANNLYYDGDTYESDGTVTRKYGIVDLGTLDWGSYSHQSYGDYFYGNVTRLNIKYPGSFASETFKTICTRYTVVKRAPQDFVDKTYCFDGNATQRTVTQIQLKDTSYSDAESLKASLSGVYLVYELATPTTETAEPYQNPQIVNDFGTEEYVDERAVPIPVGHQTKYLANLRAKLEMAPDSPSADGEYIVKQTNGQNEYIALGSSTTMQSIMAKLPNPPSEDGTYTLKVTVANGTATYSWGE